MSKKVKLILIFTIVFLVLSVSWFDLVFLKNNANLFKNQLRDAGRNADVIIVFNSGGWGTISLERAYDFNPIINNIKSLLESKSHNVAVVTYYRTKETFFARIASLKDMLLGFPDSSETLADKISNFLKDNPSKKIVLAGLSNGASLVNSTMKDMQNNANVFAIEFGAPFSKNELVKDNILLINNDKDALAHGELWPLVLSVIKSPFVYFSSVLQGKYISYSEAIKIDGHNYPWDLVKADITFFLDKNIN